MIPLVAPTPPANSVVAQVPVQALLDKLMSVVTAAWPQVMPWVLLMVAGEIISWVLTLGSSIASRGQDAWWTGVTAKWYADDVARKAGD